MECDAVCPKEVSMDCISMMNKDLIGPMRLVSATALL